MPLIPEPSVLGERARVEQKARPGLSYMDSLAIAFERENSFGALVRSNLEHEDQTYTPQDGYNPFEGDELHGYEDFANAFVSSVSPEQTTAIKGQIDDELRDRQLLHSAGWKGITGMLVASALDPIELAFMLVPGGQAKKAETVGSIVLKAAAGTAATESVLQSKQATRGALETTLNITSSALLAGILGKAAGALDESRFAKLTDQLDKELNGFADDGPSTAGAAARASTTLDDETLVAEKAAKLFTFGGKLNPYLRVMTSASVSARRAMQKLAESSLLTRKNKRGVRTDTAVETLLKRENGVLAQFLRNHRNHFVAYRKAGGTMRASEFNRAVGRALRRGDKADDPAIDAAAKVWRPFFDRYKNRAIAAGALPEGVTPLGADTYLTRVYLHDTISNRRNEWNDILHAWLRDKGVAEEEIASTAAQITANLRGAHEGIIPRDIVPTAGPLKERTFGIRDELIDEFLENDVTVVANLYQRSIAPEVLLREAFDGEKDLRGVISAIHDDYNNAIVKASRDTKKVRQLEREREKTIEAIEAQRDRLLGTYGAPANPSSAFVRVGRFARKLNYLRLLGGMTVSAIVDVSRPVFQHGLRRTLGKGLGNLVADFDRLKLAANDVQRMGAAAEIVLNTRQQAIADIGESVGARADVVADKVTRGFSVATGMVHWNDYMKRFSGLLTADSILEASRKWARGQIKAGDIKRLAQSGIDEDLARRITKQFEKHGEDGNLKVGQSYRWDDAEARQAFESAVIKDVDTAIVTPGIADKPLWMSGEGGKLVGQFKSFSFASVNRVLLTTLQGRDAHALSGIMAMAAFGALTVWAKEKTTGYKVSRDPGTLIDNIIDRTGFFGILYDLKNIAERTTGHTVIGNQVVSRYQSRNVVGALLGPSFGLADDIRKMAYGTSQGELSDGDIHAMRRLMPYQNLFYLNWLFDALEEQVAEGPVH